MSKPDDLRLPSSPDEFAFCDTLHGTRLGCFDMAEHVTTLRQMLGALYTWRREVEAPLHDRTAPSEHSADLCADAAFNGTFADVAISQAAVGALSPMFETFFRRSAEELRKRWDNRPLPDSSRKALLAPRYFWDPLLVATPNGKKKKTKNIRLGYRQLLETLGLNHVIDPRSDDVIEALWVYRNCALHEGYEWSPEKLSAYKSKANPIRWSSQSRPTHVTDPPHRVPWFAECLVDGQPWLFLVTNAFVEAALDSLDRMAKALTEAIRKP